MTPPVALLAYQPDEPQNAVFYPFCGVLARVAGDALCRTEPDTFPLFRLASDLFAGSFGQKKTSEQETETTAEVAEAGDPFDWLAHAGFTDGESWWETMIEHRQEPADIFRRYKRL